MQIHAKENSPKSIDFIITCPKNQKGYWSIGKNDVLELNEILFVDTIKDGLTIKITFIEEDVTGILVHKAIQELIDDYIGEIIIKADTNETTLVEEGKNTKLKELNGNEYILSLTGSGASYKVTLHIK